MKARYIINLKNGELFGWNIDWLKQSGFVEYDPELHGYRSEVAHILGLEPAKPTTTVQEVVTAPDVVTVTELLAGAVITPHSAAPAPTDTDEVSDLFDDK